MDLSIKLHIYFRISANVLRKHIKDSSKRCLMLEGNAETFGISPRFLPFKPFSIQVKGKGETPDFMVENFTTNVHQRLRWWLWKETIKNTHRRVVLQDKLEHWLQGFLLTSQNFRSDS